MSSLPRADPSDLIDVIAPPMSAATRAHIAGSARAIADPQRIEILYLLAVAARPVCALDVEYHLGLAQSTVSHHLKVLVDAGVCGRETRGRWSYFSLRPAAMAHFRHQLEALIHFPQHLPSESDRTRTE